MNKDFQQLQSTLASLVNLLWFLLQYNIQKRHFRLTDPWFDKAPIDQDPSSTYGSAELEHCHQPCTFANTSIQGNNNSTQ